MRRVVVTGLGALTPIGNTISEYSNGLQNGANGANPITHFDAEKFKTRFAAEVKNFDAKALLDRKDVRRLDPFAQYAMVTVAEAMEDAGFDLEAIDLERAGVIWASGIGGFSTLQHEITEHAKGNGTPRYLSLIHI